MQLLALRCIVERLGTCHAAQSVAIHLSRSTACLHNLHPLQGHDALHQQPIARRFGSSTSLNLFAARHTPMQSEILKPLDADDVGTAAEQDHAALRHIPIAQLPHAFQAALRSYIASSGASAKEVRLMVEQFKVKAGALEKHLQTNAAPPNMHAEREHGERTVSGRVTQQALYEASIALEHEGAEEIDPEVFNKLLNLPPPSSTTNRGKVKPGAKKSMRGTRPKPFLEYNEQQALAAAASCSPAWYVTNLRVLHELRSADASFKPMSMLDFGAGFGGATQAAQQVWTSQLRNVTAVERSPTLLQFGANHMRQAAASAHQAEELVEAAAAGGGSDRLTPSGGSPVPRGASYMGPRVTWVRSLPKLPGKDGASTVSPRYNLVVAAYVLSEETLPQERLRLIDQLWGHTSDVLVLIEHGSRIGSSLILEARGRILDREVRKAARQQQQQQQASLLKKEGSTTSAKTGTEVGAAPEPPSLPVGAHVVAPCPHDGRCPLQGNQKAWCHFGQRYEAPEFTRKALMHKGGSSIRNPMDTHFSYVILRRGPRPQASLAPAAHLSGSSVPKLQDQSRLSTNEELWQKILLKEQASDKQLDTGQEREDDVELHEARATSTKKYYQTAAPARPRQPLFAEEGDAAGAMSDGLEGSCDRKELSRSSLSGQGNDLLSHSQPLTELDDQHEVLHSTSHGTAQDGQHGSLDNSSMSDEDELSEDVPLSGHISVLEAFQRKYPAHSLGLVDRLMALEDAGISWTNDTRDGGLDKEAVEAAMAYASSGPQEDEQEDDDTEHAASFMATGSSGSGAQYEREAFPWQQEHNSKEAGRMLSTEFTASPLQDADPEQSERALWRLQQQHLDSSSSSNNVPKSTYGGDGMPWPRLFRKPLKRGGHVVLDLCMPPEIGEQTEKQGGQASMPFQGRLERQVISKARACRLLSSKAYDLAKQASWGDLWPAYFLIK